MHIVVSGNRDGACVGRFGCASARAAAIYFQACSFNRELLVTKERVRDAEEEVEGNDADDAREQLVELLFRAPARRAFREQTLVDADRVDSVPPVGDRIGGDRNDLPALVACAPGGRRSPRRRQCWRRAASQAKTLHRFGRRDDGNAFVLNQL